MKAWKMAAGLIGAGLLLGASGQASADSACTVFNAAGSTTFAGASTGAYIGTVDGSTCQIGAAPNTQGITDNAVLSSSTNPQIYEFYFGGGSLTVEEVLGNQGTGTPVDVELDYLGTSQSVSAPSSVLDSVQVPYQSAAGATTSFSVDNLGAGYYAVNSYFGSAGTQDPQYEVFVTDAPATNTPEAGSGLLLGLGLMGIAAATFMRRRALSC
jgi:MYXO-CTERM domain-containing protein